MIIEVSALKKIDLSISDFPPETGGILGSLDGSIVTDVIIDEKEMPSQHACSYAPNVEFLNACLYDWMLEGKYFMGIFHTHFCGVRTLSFADKKYIVDIMNAMPQEINSLYFPIFVLPDRELICYKAVKRRKVIYIENDILQIICKGGGIDET